uniref:Uncharacterized protein n=1 Tax=uncultured marine thaumarchaeote AD1000_01_F04 TaxID=1455879 RepID=A0A075FKG0_9ARCH|nr:hypothetical protein [uncultured marine thaumarchaeote AD1000_01_F04]
MGDQTGRTMTFDVIVIAVQVNQVTRRQWHCFKSLVREEQTRLWIIAIDHLQRISAKGLEYGLFTVTHYNHVEEVKQLFKRLAGAPSAIQFELSAASRMNQRSVRSAKNQALVRAIAPNTLYDPQNRRHLRCCGRHAKYVSLR